MPISYKTYFLYAFAAVALSATGAIGVYTFAKLAPDAFTQTSNRLLVASRNNGYWEGIVVRVIDGDTAIIAAEGGAKVKVHLDDIEAPALDTEYGQKSKRVLASLIYRSFVTFEQTSRRRDGGFVGVMRFSRRQGPSVNEKMVALGAARAGVGRGVDERIKILAGEAEDRQRGVWASEDRSEEKQRSLFQPD